MDSAAGILAGASLEGRLDIHRLIAQLANLGYWHRELKQIVRGDLSSLDIALLCNGDLAAVQRLHAEDSNQISERTIYIACKQEGTTEVLEFFATQAPDRVSCDALSLACEYSFPKAIFLAKLKPELLSMKVTYEECWKDPDNYFSK